MNEPKPESYKVADFRRRPHLTTATFEMRHLNRMPKCQPNLSDRIVFKVMTCSSLNKIIYKFLFGHQSKIQIICPKSRITRNCCCKHASFTGFSTNQPPIFRFTFGREAFPDISERTVEKKVKFVPSGNFCYVE